MMRVEEVAMAGVSDWYVPKNILRIADSRIGNLF